jgi:hypothetical protein
MRVDQSRHQRPAGEIHALRIGAGLRQHLIPGADCNDLPARDRDGVGAGLPSSIVITGPPKKTAAGP